MKAADEENPRPALRLTNVDKVYYPDDGFTKGDVLAYYDRVAGLILPHLKDRPLSLKRYPDGIGKEHFFQKNSPESFPSWLRMEEIDGTRYIENAIVKVRMIMRGSEAMGQ